MLRLIFQHSEHHICRRPVGLASRAIRRPRCNLYISIRRSRNNSLAALWAISNSTRSGFSWYCLYQLFKSIIISVILYSPGNIASCAQQETRTPVQPSWADPRGPTTGWNSPGLVYLIFIPFSSTVITSTSIASPGISLVTVIVSPGLSPGRVSVTVCGFVSL